jgi:hypothetical protein
VTGVNVHGNVGQVERLESVCNTIAVTTGRVLAGLEVGVCDQVRKRIWFDDKGNGNVGVLLEDSDNGYQSLAWSSGVQMVRMLTVNVLGLVGAQATDWKLSVGGLSSAITTGEIVDDQSGNLVTRNVLDRILDN